MEDVNDDLDAWLDVCRIVEALIRNATDELGLVRSRQAGQPCTLQGHPVFSEMGLAIMKHFSLYKTNYQR